MAGKDRIYNCLAIAGFSISTTTGTLILKNSRCIRILDAKTNRYPNNMPNLNPNIILISHLYVLIYLLSMYQCMYLFLHTNPIFYINLFISI